MDYRREIDGLRAVAVLPVILFHAGFSVFSGGFVGVDVFFVISGYLITTIISDELDDEKFSLVNFYERRARRILPALVFVMCACFVLSWLWLLPNHMREFSRSMIAVSAFVANIFFWRESGYFDTVAELKPLLHTWSLAVEEQYYMIFPVFLMLAWKFGRRRVVAMLALAFVASMMAAEWGSVAKPGATFYLLPTRGWELLIGSFAAFYLSEQRSCPNASVLREAYGWIGLCSIAYSVFAFDNKTPFPSLYALVPTVGASLIILFATQHTYIGKALGSRPLVGVGVVSYSAYLWHQPLFAFARQSHLEAPSKNLLASLAALSLLLAFISHKYVETPFRKKGLFTRKHVFGYSLAALSALIFAGLLGELLNGFPIRYTDEERNLISLGDISYKQTMVTYGLGHCFIDYEQSHDVLLKEKCVSESASFKRVIVFGDSEAAHWMAGVRKEFVTLGYSVEQWTGTSCRAIHYAKNNRRCEEFYDAFVKYVVPGLKNTDVIIIASRWVGVLNDVGESVFTESVDDLFMILKHSGVNVVVVGNTPEFSQPPHHIMVKSSIANRGDVMLASQDFRVANKILVDKAAEYGYVFFSPSRVLCGTDNSLNCLVARDGVFYFFDSGHLSPAGSEYLMHHFIGDVPHAGAVF